MAGTREVLVALWLGLVAGAAAAGDPPAGTTELIEALSTPCGFSPAGIANARRLADRLLAPDGVGPVVLRAVSPAARDRLGQAATAAGKDLAEAVADLLNEACGATALAPDHGATTDAAAHEALLREWFAADLGRPPALQVEQVDGTFIYQRGGFRAQAALAAEGQISASWPFRSAGGPWRSAADVSRQAAAWIEQRGVSLTGWSGPTVRNQQRGQHREQEATWVRPAHDGVRFANQLRVVFTTTGAPRYFSRFDPPTTLPEGSWMTREQAIAAAQRFYRAPDAQVGTTELFWRRVEELPPRLLWVVGLDAGARQGIVYVDALSGELDHISEPACCGGGGTASKALQEAAEQAVRRLTKLQVGRQGQVIGATAATLPVNTTQALLNDLVPFMDRPAEEPRRLADRVVVGVLANPPGSVLLSFGYDYRRVAVRISDPLSQAGAAAPAGAVAGPPPLVWFEVDAPTAQRLRRAFAVRPHSTAWGLLLVSLLATALLTRQRRAQRLAGSP